MKLKNQYIVKMNGYYMNSFEDYIIACDFRNQLERKYKNAKIEIVLDQWYE